MAYERHILAEDTFAEIVVLRVPRPVKGSTHRFTYRLALVVAGDCVLRYDNESGKVISFPTPERRRELFSCPLAHSPAEELMRPVTPPIDLSVVSRSYRKTSR